MMNLLKLFLLYNCEYRLSPCPEVGPKVLSRETFSRESKHRDTKEKYEKTQRIHLRCILGNNQPFRHVAVGSQIFPERNSQISK